MAVIWSECERGEKGMMRDPDEPLPQKQGLISTSHPAHQGLTLSFHNTTKEPKIRFCSAFCQNEEISLTRALQSDLLNQDCTSIVVWREGSFCGDNKDDQKLFWKVTHKYILLGSNLNQNDSR